MSPKGLPYLSPFPMCPCGSCPSIYYISAFIFSFLLQYQPSHSQPLNFILSVCFPVVLPFLVFLYFHFLFYYSFCPFDPKHLSYKWLFVCLEFSILLFLDYSSAFVLVVIPSALRFLCKILFFLFCFGSFLVYPYFLLALQFQ